MLVRSSSIVFESLMAVANSSFSSGSFFSLTSQHFDGIGIVFARQLRIGILGRVIHLEAAMLARLRAEQILSESFEGLVRTDVA